MSEVIASPETPITGVNIDPASWEDPKESFPGRIVLSQYRWADEKYRAETEFRPALPPFEQWALQVERLDARGVTPEGAEVPLTRYGGADLKKWDKQNEKLVPLSSRNAKEWFIVNEFKRVFGTIHPPEVLEGKIAMFDFYETKSFSGRFTARNILVPTTILSPDYQFTGEVRLIQFRNRDEDEDTGPTQAVTGMSNEEAESQLAKILPGMSKGNTVSIIQALSPELRTPYVLEGVASGTLIEKLIQSGKLTVNGDNVLAAGVAA